MPPPDAGSHRLVLAGLFAATAAFLWPSLAGYVQVWGAQPYTHGWLVALATGWLVWRERDALRVVSPWQGAFPAAAGLSLLWLFATIANARAVVLAVVPLLLLAWAAALFGRGAASRLAPAVAVFLLAVPLWGVLVPPLQRLTVVVSGGLVHLLGIPAEIDGDLIHIQLGSFLIADGCAGLNYLLSGLTVGALYALGLVRPWPGRVAVLILSAAIPIVGNWIRVAALIALGHYSEMRSIFITQPRPHLWLGWGIFLLGLGVFFPLAARLERWASRRWPPAASPRAVAPDTAARSPGAPAWRTALGASLVVSSGPILYLSIGSLPVREVSPFALAAASESWIARPTPARRPYGWTPAFLGPQEHHLVSWTDGARSVLLDRLVYLEQRQGAELIGYNGRIAADSLVVARRLYGPVGTRGKLVNEAIVRDRDTFVLVWYWYRVGGIDAVDPLRAKLLEVWAFFSRRTAAELIAISAACTPDTCAEASRALSSLLGP